MQNPFTEDIYPVDYARLDLAGSVVEIHESTVNELSAMIENAAAPGLGGVTSGHGGTALLIGPRAGVGKTHLLHRLAREVEGKAIMIPITFNLDESISWRTILGQVLDRLADRDPSTGELGLSYVQEIARRMFAEVTSLLIEEGEIPSANPRNAIAGLKRNYLRLFDVDEEDSAVRDWLTNNFDQLRPVMANVLAERRGMVESSAGFWLEILREANDNKGNCAEVLSAACPPDGDAISINSISKLRLSNLCRLATIDRPLVFVFDHLDCFHERPERGLEIAYLVSELRLLSQGQVSIVSMNRDLWNSAFGGHLPDALADRLSAHPLALSMLHQDEAENLVRERASVAGLPEADIENLLRRLELPASDHLTPRVALRCAARDWKPSVSSPGTEDASEVPPAAALMEKETLSRIGDVRPIPPNESVPLKSLLFDDPLLAAPQSSAKPEEKASPSKVDPSEIKKKGNILAMVERLKTRRKEAESDEAEEARRVASSAEIVGNGEANGNGAANGGAKSAGYGKGIVPIALRQRASRPPLHPLVQRFRRLRAELSPEDLSQESLRTIVRAVGEQSPVVDYSETRVPQRDASLARWEEPDGDVFFCFSNDEDSTRWAELLEIGAEKLRLSYLDEQNRSKLVVFAKDGPSAMNDAKGDRVEFDANQSTTLEAAARLLADPALPPAETLRLLSSELDFFWKRITRSSEPAKV